MGRKKKVDPPYWVTGQGCGKAASGQALPFVQICAVLALNALLGLWFALECKKAAPVLEHRNGQGGKVCCCYRLHHTRNGGKLQ